MVTNSAFEIGMLFTKYACQTLTSQSLTTTDRVAKPNTHNEKVATAF
jgi:hypothetical protein